MNTPQIIMLTAISVDILFYGLMDGTERGGTYKLSFKMVDIIFLQALLYWGGFWG